MTATSYAEILHEYVKADGTVVVPPSFDHLPDDGTREDAIIAWSESFFFDASGDPNGNRQRRFCSADRTPVTIHVVGTSETAICGRGHRWLRTFGPNDQYIQTQ